MVVVCVVLRWVLWFLCCLFFWICDWFAVSLYCCVLFGVVGCGVLLCGVSWVIGCLCVLSACDCDFDSIVCGLCCVVCD